MQIMPVAEMLVSEGLAAPLINALIPNEVNYTVALMQPCGHIEASTMGVRNRNRALARMQFRQFLAGAQQTGADLMITPEYSMPWETLVEAIKANCVPADGKLWALGCESIKYSELEALKHELAPWAAVLFEQLQPDQARFTDPLAYVFAAAPIDGSGASRIVVLVQFKTCPMGDNNHFEVNGMQRGTRIYQFGGAEQNLKLVSLICSDVFAFRDEDALAVYDRALVIHIQLNPKPRQGQFRQYRNQLLRYDGDETELICLNWAGDVCEWSGDKQTPWKNIAGSAWYLRPKGFDERDATLNANHGRGLYYTWLDESRAHALFFNYKPAIYLLVATKVAHIGVTASVSRRRGPQLTKTCVWDDATGDWVEQSTADDGFSAFVGECGQAKEQIQSIHDTNPMDAERLLALCAGKVKHDGNWYSVRRLDSCVIDASEVIHRMTFCQDTDPGATEFRVGWLRRCARLWDILKTHKHLPPALVDFKDGFRLEWSSDSPHQNAISEKGKRATVVYMGEESSSAHIEEIAKTLAEFLHRGCADPRESRSAQQRLAVWFRENEAIVPLNPDRYIRFDQAGDTSEFDIARET
jgi:hypothetical protein